MSDPIYNPVTHLGKSFNIFDEYSTKSAGTPLVDLDSVGTKTVTFLGTNVTIPLITTLTADTFQDAFGEAAETRAEFQESFAAHASADFSTSLFAGEFSGQFSSAYAQESKTSSEYQYAFKYFFERLGYVTLDEVGSAYLKDAVKTRLASLPSQFTDDNFELFAEFFESQGTHYLSRIELGAVVEFYVSIRKSIQIGSTDMEACLGVQFDGLFTKGNFDAGVKLGQSWSNYQKNVRTHIRGSGGDPMYCVKLGLSDPWTPQVDPFGEWLKTIPQAPAAMNLRVDGIWKLCDTPDKEKAVRTAYNRYASLFRVPIEVHSTDGSSQVFVNGRLFPEPQHETPPNTRPSTQNGWRLCVIRLSDLSLVYDRCVGYNVNYFQDTAVQMYAQFKADIDQKQLQSQDYLWIVATYGVSLQPMVPTVLMPYLQEAGAGSDPSVFPYQIGIGTGGLALWADWVAHSSGADVRCYYNLVGRSMQGPGNGIEGFTSFYRGMPVSDLVTRVYLYSPAYGGPRSVGF